MGCAFVRATARRSAKSIQSIQSIQSIENPQVSHTHFPVPDSS